MSQSYAASFMGVALRISRLTSTGAIVTGATGGYQLTNFMRVSFTPEMEEGEEFFDKNAAGGICASFKANPVLKYVSLELEICEPDVEVTEMLVGGTLISSGGNNIGWISEAVGTDSNPNGSALEVWSKAVTGGKQASTLPYYRFIFPYVQLRLTGDRVIENGRLATVFTGFGLGNSNFADGPANDVTAPTASPYLHYRDSTAPTATGYFTVT